jgi:hypothetical protein
MLSSLLFTLNCIILATSIIALIGGRMILRFIPAMRKLDKEEVFITKIRISPQIVEEEGEQLLGFSKKTFSTSHVVESLDPSKLEVYLDRFKIVQMIKLAYYYDEKRVDTEFNNLRKYCFTYAILCGAVLLLSLPGTDKDDVDQNWKIFVSYFLKYISLAQVVSFYTLSIAIVKEVYIIDNLFNHRNK